MKIKMVATLSALVLLTACVEAVPIVSDFNGSSVKIVTNMLTTEGTARANSQVEADRICGRVGKTAEFASVRELPNYQQEALYLCL